MSNNVENRGGMSKITERIDQWTGMENWTGRMVAGILGFFWSTWVIMIFIGIVHEWVGIHPIGYFHSAIVNAAIWLVIRSTVYYFHGKTK